MKTFFQNCRQLILAGLLTFLITSQSMGQVITRVLSPDDQIENYIPWYNPDDKLPIVRTPFVDVEAVLEEDRRTGREMPRIGIKQEVTFSTKDGHLIPKGNYYLWSMTLNSENANSLSIEFTETSIPDDAVMFLHNVENKFIQGPVRNRSFYNESLITDYIDGDQITISIFIPSTSSPDDLRIKINKFYHGLDSYKSFDDDFNTSGTCNINVACENNMECQKNSVCKIIIGEGSCSGALVNNDCCDLTPYILTANHCFVNSGANPNTWNFRFNYESPECNVNSENSPSQWVTYFGANSRASWDDNTGTDFLLLELINDLDQNSGVSFTGWERNNSNTPNSTGIHHPSGDVKKICYDNNSNTVSGNFHRVVWDNGTTEVGSSGSPIFNTDSRIIGQLWGGQASCSNQNGWDDYGRFDLSWEGNGTNATRLRNWLGASTNPNTMDCMDQPYITGPDELCTQPRTFTLINNMPCTKNVEWEVSPSYLLASPSSGSGNSANLWAKPNVKGTATIRFTLTSNGCDPIELEKDFWIGDPNFDLFYNGPSQPCLGDVVTVFARPIPNDQNLQIINWQVSGCGQILSTAPGINAVVIEAINCVGWMRVCATAKNECGTHQICRNIYIKQCDEKEDGPINPRSISDDESSEKIEINVFPNPSNDYINVSCDNCVIDTNMKVSVLSPDGKVIQLNSFVSNISKIDLTQLLSGLYILKVDIGGEIYYKKIIKI